jgi:hypothetical protein
MDFACPGQVSEPFGGLIAHSAIYGAKSQDRKEIMIMVDLGGYCHCQGKGNI